MNEAWIFLAIGDAGGDRGSVSRSSVLSMADSINHSVPTDAELADAITSLVHAGLAAHSNSEFALTEWGRHLYAESQATRQGHITRFLALDDDWRREFPPPRNHKRPE